MHHVGLDVHKKYAQVQHMDSSGALGITKSILTRAEDFTAFFDSLDYPVSVAFEASSNYWWISQLLASHSNIESVKVIDPRRNRKIAEELSVQLGYGRAKNDRIDAEMLAHADRLNLSAAIHLPDIFQLEQRSLVRHRQCCVWLHSAIMARIRAVLNMHGLNESADSLLDNGLVAVSNQKQLPDFVLFLLEQLLDQLKLFKEQIQKTENKLTKILPETDKQIQRLMSAPGIGIVLARIITAEIFSISNFAEPKYLISYSGLAPVEQDSAGKKSGVVRLNRHCNYYLKYAFVTAAHAARQHPRYQLKYERDVKRHGKIRAKINLSRRLIKAVFWMLTRQQAFQ